LLLKAFYNLMSGWNSATRSACHIQRRIECTTSPKVQSKQQQMSKNVTNRISTSTGNNKGSIHSSKVALASTILYGFSLGEYQILETAMDEIMKE
jgi:hypothetical protein